MACHPRSNRGGQASYSDLNFNQPRELRTFFSPTFLAPKHRRGASKARPRCAHEAGRCRVRWVIHHEAVRRHRTPNCDHRRIPRCATHARDLHDIAPALGNPYGPVRAMGIEQRGTRTAGRAIRDAPACTKPHTMRRSRVRGAFHGSDGLTILVATRPTGLPRPSHRTAELPFLRRAPVRSAGAVAAQRPSCHGSVRRSESLQMGPQTKQ